MIEYKISVSELLQVTPQSYYSVLFLLESQLQWISWLKGYRGIRLVISIILSSILEPSQNCLLK